VGFSKPKECSRCDGSGIYAGRPNWVCFKCSGHGQVETDQAVLAVRKAQAARRLEAGEIVYASGSFEARLGFNQLEVEDAERFAKAVESVLAGHPHIFAALAAYAHEA
jgi:hypothetical protein